LGSGVADAAGGQQRDMEPPGGLDHRLIARLLLAVEAPPNFGIDVFLAENFQKSLQPLASVPQADQSRGVPRQIFDRRGGFVFPGAQLHARDQAAQVLVALPGGGKQRVPASVVRGDLCADMRSNAGSFRRHMKARRSIYAIPVEQRHGGNSQFRAAVRQLFGQRSALEKTKSGAGMKLDVHSGKILRQQSVPYLRFPSGTKTSRPSGAAAVLRQS